MARTSKGTTLRTVALLATALGLGSALTACGSSDSESGAKTGAVPDSVSLVIRNDVDSFDPFKSAAEAGAKQFFDAAYDTLVRVQATGTNVKVTGSLAERWDVKPDQATFHLRAGLTCADGTALTAEGIAKSIRHLADPETGGLYASRVFGPAGAKKVTADDAANTLTIELNAPFTYLVEGLSQAYVVCPTALDDIKKLATTPAETGAYKVTDFKRGEKYVLTRRATPAVAEADLPKTLELRVVGDDTTRANLIDTKGVDIASVLGRDAQRVKRNADEIDGKAFLSDAMLFNQVAGHPGADVELRRALSLAVDSAGYTKAATFDLGEPIDTMYTPNMACYTKGNGKLATGFNADEAKAALDKAGYGANGKKLTIRLLGIESQNSGPDFIADSLRKIGVDVKLSKGTLEQALGVLFGTGEWDVMIYPYPVPTPLPSTLVNQISGKLGDTLNVGSVANADYDRLAAEAASITGDRQCELWGQAEAALLEQVDIKPLVWSNAAWFTHGLTFSSNYFNIDTRTIRQAN